MTTPTIWDPALPQFVLELRDETSWALLPISMRQASAGQGLAADDPARTGRNSGVGGCNQDRIDQ